MGNFLAYVMETLRKKEEPKEQEIDHNVYVCVAAPLTWQTTKPNLMQKKAMASTKTLFVDSRTRIRGAHGMAWKSAN